MIKVVKNKNIINSLILVIYVAILIVLALHHEPWRDEAQQWLIVRELSIPEIISQMKYEGHPCLWYLILFPMVKLGAPYGSAVILGIILCVIAVALLLWKSNMPVWAKCLALLTSSLLFYSPIVTRSYCLIPLFVFLNAYLYEKRFDKPLLYGLTLALVVQTHVVLIGFSAFASLIWLIETLKKFKENKDKKFLLNQALGLFEPLISAILLLLQLKNVSSSSSFNIASFSAEVFQTSLVCTIQGVFWIYNFYGAAFAFLLFVLGIVLMLFYIIKEKNYNILKTFLIFFFSFLVMALISTFVYLLANHIWQIVVILVIWFLWVSNDYISSKDMRMLVCLLFVVILIPSIYMNWDTTIADIRYPYSESKPCAEFIETSIDKDAVIFCEDTGYDPAVIANISNGTKVYSLVTGEEMTFRTWHEAVFSVFGYDSIMKRAKEINPNCSDVYIVLSGGTLFTYITLPNYIPYGGEQVYASEGKGVTDDNYIIIKVCPTEE